MYAFPSKLTYLILIGLIFHVVYLFSIFDIYFRSPIVHGMEPVKQAMMPPAKRLVLFVADGLRADTFFELKEVNGVKKSKAPFLRSVVEQKGSFGISHTHVPTESRPGHVAILAGMYEDVSAVTKGWQVNPVEFDSLLNRSSYSWAIGSPDIVLMFGTAPHITALAYEYDLVDFAEDATILDKWTFDTFYKLFEQSKHDQNLQFKLHQDQAVFFLHLLGIDNNGHAFRPDSDEYRNNLSFVDKKIKEAVEFIENHFQDNSTAYVLTADHGMSSLGSHGDGNPENTRTPLVVWGSGVAGPSKSLDLDEFSLEWGLERFERKDVEQADIAPLMASLIGVEFPVNSVGVLPIQYLDGTAEFKSQALFANAKQIFAQYIVKERIKKSHEIFFEPFPELNNEDHSFDTFLNEIDTLLNQKELSKAQIKCYELIEKSLKGLRYLQTFEFHLF